MSSYAFECEPIVVTTLTGQLGTACVSYRGHDYRITLGGPGCTRDGIDVALSAVPKPVHAYATRIYDLLRKEHSRASNNPST